MYPLYRGDNFHPRYSKFDDIHLLRKLYLFQTEIRLYIMNTSIRLSWPVSYRLWCVVVCDLETSRIGAPYIYDISHLRVKQYCFNISD